MTQPTNTPNQQQFIDFINPIQWQAWLAEHHDSQDDVWLRIAKKDSGKTSITIPEALDIALSYGWIDSHRKGYNESYYLQRYSPRRPRSPWSLINVNRAKELIADGRMQPSGYEEVHAAQADGRWEAAYESQRAASVPADLIAALEQHKKARYAFEQLDKSRQYLIFLPILKTSSEKSRAAQIQKAISLLEEVQP